MADFPRPQAGMPQSMIDLQPQQAGMQLSTSDIQQQGEMQTDVTKTQPNLFTLLKAKLLSEEGKIDSATLDATWYGEVS
jgi:hypothetical protein